MRAVVAIAVVSVALMARAASAQDQAAATRPEVLTLAAAVEQALDRGDRMAASRDQTRRASLSLRQARSAFTPKFASNLFGSFGQTDIANQSYGVSFSQKLATGTEVKADVGASTAQNQLGNFYSTDTTLLVSQPLLRGFGRTAARLDLTRAEAGVAEADRQQALAAQQVAIEVAAAYYRVVSEAQMATIAEKTVERARQLLEASRAKLGAGKVSRLDVLRAEQLVAESDMQLLDARAAVDDAKDDVRLMLRRGPEYDFSVSDDIPVVTGEIGEDAAVATARARRLDLQSATAAVLDAQRSASAARNARLPQFDLNAAFTRRQTAESLGGSFGLDKFRFATFATVSMPFDRTSEDVAFENATIDAGQRVREREALDARIAQEVRHAVRQHARLLRSLDLATTSLEFASQEVDLATLRYQRGLSNNLDVVNAESNLLAARGRRLSLLADVAVARLRLRAAMGVFDPHTDVR